MEHSRAFVPRQCHGAEGRAYFTKSGEELGQLGLAPDEAREPLGQVLGAVALAAQGFEGGRLPGGQQPEEVLWLGHALSLAVLVVATPCPLLLAAPIAIVSGKFVATGMERRLRCAGLVEFAGLDAPSRRVLEEMLARLNEQGKTVVLVTHDNRILDVADRILHLEDGRMKSLSEVVSEGTSRMLNLLEKHGLIQEVDTIVKANIIEKVYWITAYECKMDHDLFNFSTPEGQESVITAMVTPIDSTMASHCTRWAPQVMRARWRRVSGYGVVPRRATGAV